MNEKTIGPDKHANADNVYRYAVKVFGSEAKANSWLENPKRIFNGRSPLQVISTEDGIKAVEEVLNQIDSGYFA